VLAGVVILGIVCVSITAVVLTNSTDDSVRAVTDARRFDLPSLRGSGRVRMADNIGRPVVVNFFASWCSECDAELPGFHRAAQERSGDVAFVFVNSNDRGNGTAMAERHSLFDFPVARDIGGSDGDGLYRAVGARRGMPVTAFFDERGRLLELHYGALIGEALPRALDRIYG
jgi:thiol-disulfide isomerase/thioredoxin